MTTTLNRTLNDSSEDKINTEERIKIRDIEIVDVIVMSGSAVSALALSYFFFQILLPVSGVLGFLVCWYVFFNIISTVAVWELRGAVKAKDHLARTFIWTGGMAAVVPLILVLVYVIGKGYHSLRPQFFTQDQKFVGALSDSTEGGGAHAIIGTLQQVGLASLISVPLGITTAVYLNEVNGRLAKPLRIIIDAMSAVPSIVAGLFIYAAWILALGNQQNGLAGSLALAVLFLPTVTRTSKWCYDSYQVDFVKRPSLLVALNGVQPLASFFRRHDLVSSPQLFWEWHVSLVKLLH